MGKFFELPSPENRDRVLQLARFGAAEETIAAELQIPLKRLRKQFRRELQQGEAEGKHRILENVYYSAAGSNNAATTFWIKSRCGWRDTGVPPVPPQIVKPVLKIVLHRDPAPKPKPHEPGIPQP